MGGNEAMTITGTRGSDHPVRVMERAQRETEDDKDDDVPMAPRMINHPYFM